MPSALPVLVTTTHASSEIPHDVIARMLGDAARDPEARRRLRRRLFHQSDPWTDALFELDGARAVHATVSRFVVDLDRTRTDRSENGVIKRVDFAREALYVEGNEPGLEEQEERLERYWDPFHATVTRTLGRSHPLLLLDGHCMTPVGPALGPDLGTVRPAFNLITGGDERGEPDPSIGDGSVSVPGHVARGFADALWREFRDVIEATPVVPAEIALNHPFAVGGIQGRYGGFGGTPVISLEFNRALYLRPNDEGYDVPMPGRLADLNARLRRTVEAVLPLAEQLHDEGGWLREPFAGASGPAAGP